MTYLRLGLLTAAVLAALILVAHAVVPAIPLRLLQLPLFVVVGGIGMEFGHRRRQRRDR